MAFVTYEFAIKRGTVLQALALAEEIAAGSRAWEGCLDMVVGLDESSDTLFIFERWESREHMERYLQWRRENPSADRLAESGFLAGKPVRRIFREL